MAAEQKGRSTQREEPPAFTPTTPSSEEDRWDGGRFPTSTQPIQEVSHEEIAPEGAYPCACHIDHRAVRRARRHELRGAGQRQRRHRTAQEQSCDERKAGPNIRG